MEQTARARSRREEAKQETRKALIRAGLEEMMERGFDAPSLDSICARAGYTRGAFYVHFQNREDFVHAVVSETLSRFLGDAAAEDGGPLSLDDLVVRLSLLVDGGVPASAVPGLRLPQLLEAATRLPLARQSLRHLQEVSIARVEKVVIDAQAAGALRTDVDADTLATLVVGFAAGALVLADAGTPLDTERLQRAMLTMLRP